MNDKYLISNNVAELIEILSSDNISLSDAQLCEALAYLRVMKVSPADIRSATGIKEPQIRHYVRVCNKLITPVMDMLHRNKISFSLARAIASLPAAKQEDAAREAISKNTSVSDFRNDQSDNRLKLDQATRRYYKMLEDLISAQTGMDLTISPDATNKNNGNINIRYVGNDMFEAACTRMGVDLSDF